jgi:hypothetical protein
MYFLFGLYSGKKIMYTDIEQILKIDKETEKIIALHMFCGQRYKSWTETEKLIYSIIDLENEVMNGGFLQYFRNSCGDQWQNADIGLEKIGAIKSKKLLDKAATLFPASMPSLITTERQAFLDNLSKEELPFFNHLDDEFIAYEDNIGHLVVLYAEKHRDDFGKL